MKIVIQKVTEAKVISNQKTLGSIKEGLLLLVGLEDNDNEINVLKAADKIANLRIFMDENDKMNKSILDIGGKILSISQFTLAADIRKGNRPSFTKAMAPLEAKELYEQFNQALINHGLSVETGDFQTHMNVVLNNDGPVTIIMEVKDGKVI